MEKRKLTKRILLFIAFVYVVVSYQVLLDSVVTVNKNSLFYSRGGFFTPGYALGMFLGLIGGNGWIIVGQIVTFIGIYMSLNFVFDILNHKEKH